MDGIGRATDDSLMSSNADSLVGRTVLVIGGAGYVGSVLVQQLLNAGARVRILDNLLYDNGFAIQHLLDDHRLTFVKGDLMDAQAFRVTATGVTDVVLLAALVGDPICKKYPELAVNVNRQGAQRIIDALDDLDVQRLVFTSTCSNYGIRDPSSLATETSELNPQSLYARTKIDVEDYLLDAATNSHFIGTVLRIATAYGLSPRMRFDLTVSQFAYELASGAELVVYDPDTWRPYCHIRDLCKAVIAVLEAKAATVDAEVFNVGNTDQTFTKRMIVEEVLRHVPEGTVAYLAGDTDPRNYRVSFAKIAKVLDFHCNETVQDYLPKLVAAVRAGVFPEARAANRFGNYTIDKPALRG